MREVQRSAIVPYSAAAMFDIIADIDAYPAFLPGCSASRIITRDAQGVLASLSLSKGPLQATFTTRNEMQPPARIGMHLRDGPFRELEGEWQLAPLGESGCRITLRVRFEFSNKASDLLLGPVFEVTCNSLVDAFVSRARALYG